MKGARQPPWNRVPRGSLFLVPSSELLMWLVDKNINK